MNKMFTQPTGPVAKQTNKQAIARTLGIKQSAVGYLSTDTLIDNYTVLYDPLTQTSWFRDTATGTPVSWDSTDGALSLITNIGTFKLLNTDLRSNLGLNNGAKWIGGLGFLTPEMFGAVGDGVTDDTAAIQAAINTALSSSYKMKVVGMGIYALSSSLAVDNFARGFCLDLAGLTVLETFPTYSDWKDATPAILVGAASNGSQVGLEISIGYFHGGDKATLFRLSGYGAGGSRFHAGRVRNAVGVYQVGDHVLNSGCSSNIVTGDYWYNGVFGVRAKRNGSYITEGTKIQVGFMTNLKYGGIQLFNGAQYFQIYGTDIDFCGKWLTQLKVDQLPSSDIRGSVVTYNNASFEVLDYYQYPRGSYYLLVIDKQETTGGNSSFATSVSTEISDGTTNYVLSGITTPTLNQFYFDFIHGFQGSPFAKGEAQFGYLSRWVGGLMHTSFFKYHNSQDINSNALNGLFVNNTGNAISFTDKWSNRSLLSYDTSGDTTALSINSSLNLSGAASFSSKVYLGGSRLFGSEFNTSLTKGTTKSVRTFSFVGNGTVTTTKEKWLCHLCGPTGINGVGGTFEIYVSSSSIEILNNNVVGVTLSVSGLVLSAVQGSQDSMNVTFMFERKM